MSEHNGKKSKKKVNIPPHLRILNSIEEAAELWALSPRIMHDLIKSGIVPSVRCGTRVLVPRVALDEAWQRLESND